MFFFFLIKKSVYFGRIRFRVGQVMLLLCLMMLILVGAHGAGGGRGRNSSRSRRLTTGSTTISSISRRSGILVLISGRGRGGMMRIACRLRLAVIARRIEARGRVGRMRIAGVHGRSSRTAATRRAGVVSAAERVTKRGLLRGQMIRRRVICCLVRRR